MPHPDRHFDWQALLTADQSAPAVVDSCRRLRWMFAGFVLIVATVMARAAWLEVTRGPAFRRLAAQPITREVSLPAVRGRILAADGTVLAHDRRAVALRMHYRWLEEPPKRSWLQHLARKKLGRRERNDRQRLEAAMARLRVQRADLHRRLAGLSGLSLDEWNARRSRVQRRIERIARNVNARRQQRFAARQADRQREQSARPDPSIAGQAMRWIEEALFEQGQTDTAPHIVVAEELAYHALIDDLPPGAVKEIEAEPQHYPGVQTREHTSRAYPEKSLAAHVVGHLGAVNPRELEETKGEAYHPDDFVGRMGIERHYEAMLRGRRGVDAQTVDRRGQVLSSRVERAPTEGHDMVLTLDLALQRSAERLLDSGLARRLLRARDASPPAGGAVVVLDIDSGAILAAASGPRFDPNLLLGGRSASIGRLLSAPDKPLFDRVTRMAIPPGSVMKVISAIALLESGTAGPEEPFHCQGYLRQPERLRCAVFRRHGVGHDKVTLATALAESCNVYFFHHATRMGHRPLVEWSQRFGLGMPTGVDLPAEAAGRLPTPRSIERRDDRRWRNADTQALAIGQSRLTTTPLQIARVMAAIGGGGRLVTPHVVRTQGERRESKRIAGLRPETLAAVRRGMERAVSDMSGTAHETVRFASVAIAAKTGTAETGGGRADHAWLAGYAPADNPQIAFVVVLEHAGGGGSAAGPVADRLVARMHELGYFKPERLASRPPVKAPSGDRRRDGSSTAEADADGSLNLP